MNWRFRQDAKERHARRQLRKDSPKVQFRCICLNKRHQITVTEKGRLILEGHRTKAELEATLVQEALSGQKAKCLNYKRILLSTIDTEHGDRSRRRWLTRRLHEIDDNLRQTAIDIDRKRKVRLDEREETVPYATEEVTAKISSSGGEVHVRPVVHPRYLQQPSRAYAILAMRVAKEIAAAGLTKDKEAHVTVALNDKPRNKPSGDGIRLVPTLESFVHSYAILLRKEWLHVFKTFRRAVIENRCIPLRIVGDMGPDRYRVIAAIPGPTQYWVEVEGVVYKRPFGQWGFMQLADSSSAA